MLENTTHAMLMRIAMRNNFMYGDFKYQKKDIITKQEYQRRPDRSNIKCKAYYDIRMWNLGFFYLNFQTQLSENWFVSLFSFPNMFFIGSTFINCQSSKIFIRLSLAFYRQ